MTSDSSDADSTMVAHDHQACIRMAMGEARARAAADGMNLTPVRTRTLEILLESHVALGAYDLLKRLQAEGFGAQPPVAYRALNFLVECGFAHRIERLNAFVACMHPGKAGEGGHEPAFMICRKCHAVAETLDNPAAEAMRGSAEGFQVERAVVEVEGICPLCQADP